ncbi:helix-turn-helix domain-containing protein, partial [Providencia sneebia]
MAEFCLEKRPDLEMKTIFTKAVGQEIYRIRRSQGLTGKDLAQKLNVSQQQVSRYECGVCHITIDNLILMLSVLNISLDTF